MSLNAHHGKVEKYDFSDTGRAVESPGRVWAHPSLSNGSQVYAQVSSNDGKLDAAMIFDPDTAQAFGNLLIEAAREARLNAERAYVVTRSDGREYVIRAAAIRPR